MNPKRKTNRNDTVIQKNVSGMTELKMSPVIRPRQPPQEENDTSAGNESELRYASGDSVNDALPTTEQNKTINGSLSSTSYNRSQAVQSTQQTTSIKAHAFSGGTIRSPHASLECSRVNELESGLDSHNQKHYEGLSYCPTVQPNRGTAKAQVANNPSERTTRVNDFVTAKQQFVSICLLNTNSNRSSLSF